MGTGQGPHSKNKQHGTNYNHILHELEDAERALKQVKKALSRASTALHRIPGNVLKDQSWLWNFQEPIDEAGLIALKLKVVIEKAIAVAPDRGRRQPESYKQRAPTADAALDSDDPRQVAEDVVNEHERKRPEARAPRVPKTF